MATLIGLISDTHGHLSDEAYAAMADVDAIIHAGDIGGPEVLRMLETLAPVTAVLGNNDFDEYGPAVGRFAHPVIDGVRFLVAHKPADVLIGFNGCAGLAAGDPIPQVRMHGHTHVLAAREMGGHIYLNPGSVSLPKEGNPRSYMTYEDGVFTIKDLEGGELCSLSIR